MASEAGDGSNSVFALINMAVLTGNLGRPGTGTSPIRGQSNVKGASDVGALEALRSGSKALLTPTPWQEPGELPDDEVPWMLTTGRRLSHYNVGTITQRTDIVKLGNTQGEALRIHSADACDAGIRHGEMVDVVSRRGRVRVRVEVTKATSRGTVFMTFHFPESRTNILTGEAVDEFTGCPEYKVCAVRLEPVGAEEGAGVRGREAVGEVVAGI
jgi:predicted molibdopterin-dependent oxidoreductase YjgC